MHIRMEWSPLTFDWTQVRAFLVTAEEGSLSAAARALGQTQPTMGRQIAALEEKLGVRLFERVGRGLELTPTGQNLLVHARAMGEAAGQFALTAAGQSQDVAGRVVITSSDLFAAYHLAPVLAELREIAPALQVDLAPANEIRDIQRREADIALRHAEPTAPNLIARKLKGSTAHFYASKSFVQKHGPIPTPKEAAGLPFLSYDRSDRYLDVLHELGLPLRDADFPHASMDGAVTVELVRAGLGIAILTRDIAEQHPDMVQVLRDVPGFDIPLWLITHQELHTSRRIRLVFDLLAQRFG